MEHNKRKRNRKKIVFQPPKVRKMEDTQTAQLTEISMKELKESENTGEFSKNLLLNATASEREVGFLKIASNVKHQNSEIFKIRSNEFSEKAIAIEQDKIRNNLKGPETRAKKRAENRKTNISDKGYTFNKTAQAVGKKLEMKEDECLNEDIMPPILDGFNCTKNNDEFLEANHCKTSSTSEILNTDILHKDTSIGERKNLSAEHNLELKLQVKLPTELIPSNLKEPKIFQNKNDALSVLPSSMDLLDKSENCSTVTNLSQNHLKKIDFQNTVISVKTENGNTFKNNIKQQEVTDNLKISEEFSTMKIIEDKKEGFYEDHNECKIAGNIVKIEQRKEYKEYIVENAKSENTSNTRESPLEMPESKTQLEKQYYKKSCEIRTKSVTKKEDTQTIFEGSSSDKADGNSIVPKMFSNTNNNSEERMEIDVVTAEESKENESSNIPFANIFDVVVPLIGEKMDTSHINKPFNKRYDLAIARNKRRFRFMKENNEVEKNNLYYNLKRGQTRANKSEKEKKRDAAREKRENLRRVHYLHAIGSRILEELKEDGINERNLINYLAKFLQASVTPTSLLYVPHLVHALLFCRGYRSFSSELRSIADDCYQGCHAMFPIPEGYNFLTVYTSEVSKILPNHLKQIVQVGVPHDYGNVHDFSDDSENDSGFEENTRSSM